VGKSAKGERKLREREKRRPCKEGGEKGTFRLGRELAGRAIEGTLLEM